MAGLLRQGHGLTPRDQLGLIYGHSVVCGAVANSCTLREMNASCLYPGERLGWGGRTYLDLFVCLS